MRQDPGSGSLSRDSCRVPLEDRLFPPCLCLRVGMLRVVARERQTGSSFSLGCADGTGVKSRGDADAAVALAWCLASCFELCFDHRDEVLQ